MATMGTEGGVVQQRMRPLACGIAAMIGAGLLDQATKWLVTVVLAPGEFVPVTPFFNLVLAYNRGVSFGMLSSDHPLTPWLLSAFAAAVILVLGFWLVRSRLGAEAAALGCIIGGALGNVVDRVRQGAVTDFLDFYAGTWHWPPFNLADSFIFIGCVMLFFVSPQGRVNAEPSDGKV